jgi:hypothetical protein
MENSNKRKFNSLYRRKIVNKINKLKEIKEFVTIFNIIRVELGKDISINKNGIFFNINVLSDSSIEKIEFFLNSISETVTESETKIKYKPYFVDDMENVNKLGPKLSNQEKSIIKKFQKF